MFIEGIPAHKHLILILKVSLKSPKLKEVNHQDLEVLPKTPLRLIASSSVIFYHLFRR